MQIELKTGSNLAMVPLKGTNVFSPTQLPSDRLTPTL